MTKTTFDYLYLEPEEKELIAKACENPFRISIAPLQKGLSGAKTLLGRIEDKIVKNSKSRRKQYHLQVSKPYVFKIGNKAKIEYEYQQIKNIAEKIIQGFPPTSITYSDDGQLAIIKQEFVGDREGHSLNLKKFIDQANDYKEVIEMINKVYNNEIANWKVSNKTTKATKSSLENELKDWLKKIPDHNNFSLLVADLGADELEKDIVKSYGLNYNLLQSFIKEIINDSVQVVTGPVHGDLHAENILIDKANNNRVSLIDFGWTDYRWKAVDFIWLECSLRYVVCTPSISFNNYTNAEDILDAHWGKEEDIDYTELGKLVHGQSLCKIIAGVATIRQNVRKQEVLKNLDEYRKGLILMSYALMTLPKINRLYLLHSICNNIIKLKGRKRKNICQYDILYASRQLLWEPKPGRMVEKAVKLFDAPKRALDVGCGDGKNIPFLKAHGWQVDAVDKSFLAIAGANRRLDQLGITDVPLTTMNVAEYKIKQGDYDLVVNYGLYHCISDEEIYQVHKKIASALRPGGIMAFAMLNDKLPMPLNHGTTEEIYLRSEEFVSSLVDGSFEILEIFSDEIEEDHLPYIGKHKHSVTWGLFKKND